MKHVKLLSLLLLIASIQIGFAQNCGFYFPLETGHGIEMKSYNGGGKPSGSYKQTVKTVTNEGGFTNAELHIENFDAKGKNVGTNDYTIKCNGTTIIIDAQSLLDPKAMESYKDMTVTIEAEDIEIPSQFDINTVLKDAGVQMKVTNQGMEFAMVDVKLNNRKVVAKETVTVPAGTYVCYKMSYDITMEMKTMGFPMTMKMKGIEYLSENAGSVKTEQYDDKGNKMGYSELEKIF